MPWANVYFGPPAPVIVKGNVGVAALFPLAPVGVVCPIASGPCGSGSPISLAPVGVAPPHCLWPPWVWRPPIGPGPRGYLFSFSENLSITLESPCVAVSGKCNSPQAGLIPGSKVDTVVLCA